MPANRNKSIKLRLKKSAIIAGSFLLSLSILGRDAAMVISYAEDAVGNAADSSLTAATADSGSRLTTNYTSVSGGYTAAPYAGEDIAVTMGKADTTGAKPSDKFGYSGDALDIKRGDTVTLKVKAPAAALYEIGFDYLSYDSSILPLELSMKLDGEYPYYEARSIKLETTWAALEDAELDRYGNEIVSLPDKLKQWEHKKLGDSSYRYSEPLLTELSAGEHTIELTVKEGSMLLGDITLSKPTQAVVISEGTPDSSGSVLITIEAEDFTYRNDSAIHAAGEYDSSLSPLSASEKLLNIVDEDSFRTAGQSISYEFSAPAAGWYSVAMNYRQSEKSDFPVFFDVKVDGEIPAVEFQSYPLPASNGFKTRSFESANGGAVKFYLSEGTHTISFTIVMDEIRYALEAVDEIMSGISDLSLEVTKVAGTNKDKYRDLKLTRYIPDLQTRLQGWVDRLYDITKQAQGFVNAKKPDDVAAFSYLLIAADQLQTLADKPDELVYRVDELSNSVNSINTQIAKFVDIMNSNKVSIDRIYIYQDGAKLPGRMNFFASLKMNISRFFNSFFGQSYSASNVDENNVQVWVNRPRQYVEIMQKMIDEDFTPKTGVSVDISLMTDAQKLVLSNASGDTPDIATGINYAIPFDLAIRGTLVDLSQFDNYKEVFGRYDNGMLVPSVVGDGLYSLPETMNFYVMFYRSDILGKLGLTPPDTMDELIGMLPDLQMRGLNVYYPTAPMLAMRNFHGTTPLIFQNGGRLYGDTAVDIELDSAETVEGFTQLTELFTLYNLPVDVPNFYQHFRNGDLPLGIADFNSYNLILNAAPEIANSWEIALVPGVKDKETGEIYRYMSGGAESTVMFKSDYEREYKAWQFMDWWSSTEVQAEFGQRLQILYGDEYIWPTANKEAFGLLPYPTEDKEIIIEQASYILEAPRLLGSYMMEREVSNAYNDVVVNGKSVRSRIDEAVRVVSRETQRKLEEFGYVDADGNVLKEYITPSVKQVEEIMNRAQ